MFNLYIQDPSNSYKYEIPFLSISATEELNVGKSATISLDWKAVSAVAATYGIDALFLLTAGLREIWVEKDGTKIYDGYISDYSKSRDSSGMKTVTIGSVGVFSILARRRTAASRVFTATDAGTIAWTLINESQLSDPVYGDLGITQGLTVASVVRDQTYRFANIKDEIVNMSNNKLDNGYDFDIDNEKKFNIYYPQRGSQKADVVFDDRTIISYSTRKPLIMSLANGVYVVGAGMNDNVLYQHVVSSSVYRAPFGLLEDVVSDRSAIDANMLTDKGNQFLYLNQSPRTSIDIVHKDDDPDILTYDVGDSVRTTLPDEYIDDFRRITKRTISIDKNSFATVKLTII